MKIYLTLISAIYLTFSITDLFSSNIENNYKIKCDIINTDKASFIIFENNRINYYDNNSNPMKNNFDNYARITQINDEIIQINNIDNNIVLFYDFDTISGTVLDNLGEYNFQITNCSVFHSNNS